MTEYLSTKFINQKFVLNLQFWSPEHLFNYSFPGGLIHKKPKLGGSGKWQCFYLYCFTDAIFPSHLQYIHHYFPDPLSVFDQICFLLANIEFLYLNIQIINTPVREFCQWSTETVYNLNSGNVQKSFLDKL